MNFSEEEILCQDEGMGRLFGIISVEVGWDCGGADFTRMNIMATVKVFLRISDGRA